MSQPRKASRRDYVKHAGAGIAVVAVGGAAYYALKGSDALDRPPVADFECVVSLLEAHQADFDYRTPERTLKYIRPNSGEKIIFSSKSKDDSSYSWFVDDRIVAETRDYSAKLPAGEHKIKLVIKRKGEGVVELKNRSEDPDARVNPLLGELFGISGELNYGWYVDGKKVSNDRDYSVKLPGGEHKVGLSVSDGRKERYTEKTVAIPESFEDFKEKDVTVDPADLPEYPKKELKIPIKGMCYSIGIKQWSDGTFAPPKDDEIVEALSIIRNELGCNGIKITGDYIEKLVKAIEAAKSMAFKVIIAQPRYVNSTVEETRSQLSEIAEYIETLRDSSVIFSVATESTLDLIGIIEGLSYDERVNRFNSNYNLYTSAIYQNRLNEVLQSFVEVARAKFHGKLTYCRAAWEDVKWDKLDFDIISSNEYYSTRWDTEEAYLNRIDKLLRFGRPVYATEFGYYTFDECLKYGGGGWSYLNDPNSPFYHGDKPVRYSQEAQALAIAEALRLLVKAKIDGVFLYSLIESTTKDVESMGIIKYDPINMRERKKSFWLYKNQICK